MITKVYYDANFAVERFRGMGKFINQFVSVMKQDLSYNVTGLLTGNRILSQYLSFGFSNYILWEQLSLFLFLIKNEGTMIFPYNTASLFIKKSDKNILIIHDLIFMKEFSSKSLKQLVGSLYRRFILPRIITKFTNIITVSEYSKRQIADFFNLDPNKIFVIPNTIQYTPDDIKKNIRFEKKENYIFHIGGEPKYKNSLILLKAFAKLSEHIKNTFFLKVVGIRSSETLKMFKKTAIELCIQDRVVFLNYQSDDEIAELYRNAKMFVLPSFEEGFGIPLIESMKYGCPLICSSTSCFPEIAKQAATYFNPSDSSDLASKINGVISDGYATSLKVSMGYEILKEYSYDKFEETVKSFLGQMR
ncbi:glycosyltransferase family 4 protein [Arcticibacter eurypsychrophilus]|uniref:glycosyltransferase family 4 protein n=1 Tax=Arcticibacter eurypsychrophilus TaxID=1434752 RepID=UPI00084DDFAC|nr:glycosyltransferase family 1 protein [Arcticibacter eurypsychrophilus]